MSHFRAATHIHMQYGVFSLHLTPKLVFPSQYTVFHRHITATHRFGCLTIRFYRMWMNYERKIVTWSSKYTAQTLAGMAWSGFKLLNICSNVFKSPNTCLSHVFMCFHRSRWTPTGSLHHFWNHAKTSYFHAATHACGLLTHGRHAFKSYYIECPSVWDMFWGAWHQSTRVWVLNYNRRTMSQKNLNLRCKTWT